MKGSSLAAFAIAVAVVAAAVANDSVLGEGVRVPKDSTSAMML